MNSRSLLAPLLSSLFPFAALAEPDDALDREKEHLIRQLKAGGSYIATYHARNEKGGIVGLEAGVHFKSGWAFVRHAAVPIQSSPGLSWWQQLVNSTRITPPFHMHSDPRGNLIIGNGWQNLIFKGHPEFLREFRKLRNHLLQIEDPGPFQAFPSLLLGKKNLSTSIQLGQNGPRYITLAEKIVTSDEETTVFSGNDIGQITVDRKTGLMLSQVFKTPKGRRSIELVKTQPNPGWVTISKKIKALPPEEKSLPFQESPLAHDLLFFTFQALVKNPEPLDLRTHLILLEEPFYRLMGHLPKDKGLFKEEFLTLVIQERLDKIAQRLKKPPLEILNDPDFGTTAIRSLALNLAMQKRQVPDEIITAALLGTPLAADSPSMAYRKKTIEGFLVHCVIRTELTKALEAYRKDME